MTKEQAIRRRPRWRRLWAGLRYRLAESRWANALRTAKSRAQAKRDIWYLYVEVFWAAVFMAVMAFNATYALRLGASNTMIGWLSSLPALFAMIILVPSARFLETQADRAPWIRRSLFVGRLAFAGVALVPWLVPPAYRAGAVVAVLILRSIPMTFFSAGFSPLLADVIPAHDRARVMANRNIIHSATLAGCTFLFGRWLEAAQGLRWAAFPANYQVLYIVGAVAAMLSVYYVGRVRVPPTPVVRRRAEPEARRGGVRLGATLAEARDAWRQARRVHRGFVRIVVNTLVFNLGAWLVMPLYIIFFVKHLNASDGWVGLNTTLAHIGVILGHLLWRRVIGRHGNDRALLLAVPMAASYAFLVALFPNLTLILLWGVLINLVNPGVNLSHFNILVGLCPEERRASYMAFFSSIMNAGAFLGPMAGVALSNVIPLRWVLVIGGLLRLVGALMFHVWRVDAAAADAATADAATADAATADVAPEERALEETE
jgi:hypothetical protein